MRSAIITSSGQWFESHAEIMSERLGNIPVFHDHHKLKKNFDILFIISYHQIIDIQVLRKNKHNIVIHASDLPSGKGWAPLFWQVLEGNNEIPFTLFEAGDGVDNGDIYFQRTLTLTGYELNEELRQNQADFIIQMCIDFIRNYDQLIPAKKQQGNETYYPKRSPQDSQLDINRSIKEQFNLLRVVNNQEYPAFFEIDGHRYTLTIEKT